MHRNYNTKDVDMLIIAATVLDCAISNREFLESKNKKWAGSFFDNLKAKMDNAIQNHLGMGNTENLRLCVQVFRGMQKDALKDLFIMKVQLAQDFKNNQERLEEIFSELGFTANYDAAQNKEQSALISLLSQFRGNATQELKAEMMNHGIAKPLIDRLLAYDKALKKAGITEANYNEAEKGITEEAVAEFNEIYESITTVSRIAAKFYDELDPIREQLTYNSVAKMLNIKKASASAQRIAA